MSGQVRRPDAVSRRKVIRQRQAGGRARIEPVDENNVVLTAAGHRVSKTEAVLLTLARENLIARSTCE